MVVILTMPQPSNNALKCIHFFYLIKLNMLNHFIKKCNFILISQSYFKTVDSYLYMLWIIIIFLLFRLGFFLFVLFSYR